MVSGALCDTDPIIEDVRRLWPVLAHDIDGLEGDGSQLTHSQRLLTADVQIADQTEWEHQCVCHLAADILPLT